MEFKVNGAKQNYSMKLGEGGEAFFVFETFEEIPESLQTSPVISPAGSPRSISTQHGAAQPAFQEPEFLDLDLDEENLRRPLAARTRPTISDAGRAKSDNGELSKKRVPIPSSQSLQVS